LSLSNLGQPGISDKMGSNDAYDGAVPLPPSFRRRRPSQAAQAPQFLEQLTVNSSLAGIGGGRVAAATSPQVSLCLADEAGSRESRIELYS
jgi:hypothetical protein